MGNTFISYSSYSKGIHPLGGYRYYGSSGGLGHYDITDDQYLVRYYIDEQAN